MLEPIHEPDPGSPPGASVVVPVLDGGDRFGHQLETLADQQWSDGLEVVVVASGSTDGSAERAAAAGCRVYRERAFGHGATRNQAVALTRAPFVVLLTQDAIPRDRRLVAQLVTPLRGDPRLAGTWARQLAPPTADPLVRATVARWCPDESRRQGALTRAELDAMAPRARAAHCRFDNVASAIRRATWETIPFPDVPFGEDAAWARLVLLAGHDLRYCAAAEVEHGHQPGPAAAYHRDRLAHELLAREFGLRTVHNPVHALLAWSTGWLGDLRDLRDQHVPTRDLPTGLLRGATRRAGALAGQWVGGRRGTAERD